MAGTYTKLLYHLVFSTKNRCPFINADLQPRLYAYMGGIVRSEGGALYEIGGIENHVHLVVRWIADVSISDFLRKLKRNSSLWVHETMPGMKRFGWQSGFGAFTVSESQLRKVRAYVLSQARHHKRMDFKEEFIGLLDAHGIEYDPEMIWR